MKNFNLNISILKVLFVVGTRDVKIELMNILSFTTINRNSNPSSPTFFNEFKDHLSTNQIVN